MRKFVLILITTPKLLKDMSKKIRGVILAETSKTRPTPSQRVCKVNRIHTILIIWNDFPIGWSLISTNWYYSVTN
jgi:hypothetical protein